MPLMCSSILTNVDVGSSAGLQCLVDACDV